MPNVQLGDIVILKERYHKALIKERLAFTEADVDNFKDPTTVFYFVEARHAADKLLAQIEDAVGATRRG